MSPRVISCHLSCLQRSHDDVPLPDGVAVLIGRSPVTKIVDPRCSRNQVELTADWSKQKVKVKQLGGNNSAIDGTDIGHQQGTMMTSGSILFVLAGQYPHKVVFKTEEPKPGNGKVKDSSDSAYESASQSKKEKKSEQKVKTDGHSGKDSNGSSSDKAEKDHKSSSSKHHKADSSHKPSKKRSIEDPHEHGEKKKMKKDSSSPSGKDGDAKEEDHVNEVAAKLEAMKKKAADTPRPVSASKADTKGDKLKKSSLELGQSSKISSTPERTSQAEERSSWVSHEQLFVYTSKGVVPSAKIAAFDIDGTIIVTKSGKKFPTDSSDWQIAYPEAFRKIKKLVQDGYKIVFFTNQLGVARGKVIIEDLKRKIENIVRTLQVPAQAFVATHEGRYRKPSDGSWKKLKEQYNGGVAVDLVKSFYVGDAAGRPANWAPKKQKDFSSSDRLFALNVGIKFQTPEEFFLNQKQATFTMPAFDPRYLKSDAPLVPKGCSLLSNDREVVILVGFPACGKSHFANQILKPKGYEVINRDTLGTWQKCVKKTKEALVNSRVVIDNTNLTKEERSRYLECAKDAGVPCRCFAFTTTFEHCRHNERFRQLTDKSHAKINEMIFNKTKSKFEEPSMSEGFTEIINVNFVPKFSSSSQEAMYRKFLLEK